MKFTRRDTMAIGGAAALATILPSLSSAAVTVDELVMGVTGGADAASTGISLTAPEIAENGNTVPISVDAASAPPVTPITNSSTGIAADESDGKMVVSAAAPPIAIVSRLVNFIIISLYSIAT